MAPKWPQISWLFLFLHDLSAKQFFFCFSQWFWVFRRGWWRPTPTHLTFIFNPATNRVNLLYFIFREAAIYLEEGHKNIDFNLHPEDKQSLMMYLCINNPIYQGLDFILALVLLLSGFFDNDELADYRIHGLNLALILIIFIMTTMKIFWIRPNRFLRHKR